MNARLVLVGWLLGAATISCSLNRQQAKRKYLVSGNRYYEAGQYQQARSMYAKAIQADRVFGEAYYRAGLTALKLQNWDEAGRYLRISTDLQPNNQDAYGRLGSLYAFAYHATNGSQPGILTELQSLSERIRHRFPGSYDDARIRGYVSVFSDDPNGALVSFAEANRIQPNQEEVILAMVRTLLAMGRAKEAGDTALEAFDAIPGAVQVYDALIAHYVHNKDLKAADRFIRLKVKNNPKVAEGHLELAAQLFSAGKLPEMEAALRPIVERSGEFHLGPFLLGDFYLRIGRWDSAAEQYRLGINSGGESKPAYQKRLVEVLAKQGKHEEAQRLIESVIKENPADLEAIAARASLAVIAEDRNRLSAAIKDFAEVADRLPDDFVLRYAYGRALLLFGNIDNAILEFRSALRIRPEYIWPRVALAFITIAAGENNSALNLSRHIVAVPGSNIPFDTAGQRPQERPLYDEILAIQPGGQAILNKLADALDAAGIGQNEALALRRRRTEPVTR